MNAKDKLIVALDVPSFEQARVLVDKLGAAVEIYKVGFQLFTAYGPFVVRFLQSQGKRVFLDLKFHDIPNTVASGVSSAVVLSSPAHDIPGVDAGKTGALPALFMLTVHTQGGVEMMRAAAQAAAKSAAEFSVAKPLIVGVTVLTSDASAGNMDETVLSRARMAKEAGLDGVVASAREAAILRRELGPDFVIITPGIRPVGVEAGDQKRVETPRSAISQGASCLVVGRPIVQAQDPLRAANEILAEIQSAL